MTIQGVPITQLPQADVPLTGDEILVIVQDGTTKQVAADEVGGSALVLLAGVATQAVAAGQTNNLATDITAANRLRITPAGDAEVTGLAGGVDGQILIVMNTSDTFLLTLPMESASSLAANRWAGNGDVIIQPRCGKAFVRDTTINRWVSL